MIGVFNRLNLSPMIRSDAQVTENFVRLAEDRQNKRGSLWNVVVRHLLRPLLHRLAPCRQPVLSSLCVLLQPNMFANWEVTFSFRIHGVRRSLRRARVPIDGRRVAGAT
jgi:hypothetical protein